MAEPITTEAEEVQEESQEQEEVSQDDAITVTEEPDTAITVEAIDPTPNQIIIKGVETRTTLPTDLQIETMTKYMVCKWLGDLKIEFKRSQPVGDLRTKLKAYILSKKVA